MRYFLDMCVILYFVGEGNNIELIKKTVNFVDKKQNNSFLVCYYIKDIDLPKWLKRQKALINELIAQKNNPEYVPYSSKESKYLLKKDRTKLTKLKIKLNQISNNLELNTKLRSLIYEIENRINEFIKKYIDEFVIPIEEIDSELTSYLMNFINLGNSQKNISDVNTIASAIQSHNNQELIIITADKKDWNKDLLEEISLNPKLNKKYPKIPEISYIQNS